MAGPGQGCREQAPGHGPEAARAAEDTDAAMGPKRLSVRDPSVESPYKPYFTPSMTLHGGDTSSTKKALGASGASTPLDRKGSWGPERGWARPLSLSKWVSEGKEGPGVLTVSRLSGRTDA